MVIKSARLMKAGIKIETLHQEIIDLIGTGGTGGIVSTPPTGKKKVLNLYWDPDTQEIVVGTE